MASKDNAGVFPVFTKAAQISKIPKKMAENKLIVKKRRDQRKAKPYSKHSASSAKNETIFDKMLREKCSKMTSRENELEIMISKDSANATQPESDPDENFSHNNMEAGVMDKTTADIYEECRSQACKDKVSRLHIIIHYNDHICPSHCK